MARKRGILSQLLRPKKGILGTSMEKRFGEAMKILSSAKPTKLRNAKPGSGCFK